MVILIVGNMKITGKTSSSCPALWQFRRRFGITREACLCHKPGSQAASHGERVTPSSYPATWVYPLWGKSLVSHCDFQVLLPQNFGPRGSVKMAIGCEMGTIPQTGVPYNAYNIQSFGMQERTINLFFFLTIRLKWERFHRQESRTTLTTYKVLVCKRERSTCFLFNDQLEMGTIPKTGVPYNAYDIQSFCMQEITIIF
jgi:hypothetical protein